MADGTWLLVPGTLLLKLVKQDHHHHHHHHTTSWVQRKLQPAIQFRWHFRCVRDSKCLFIKANTFREVNATKKKKYIMGAGEVLIHTLWVQGRHNARHPYTYPIHIYRRINEHGWWLQMESVRQGVQAQSSQLNCDSGSTFDGDGVLGENERAFICHTSKALGTNFSKKNVKKTTYFHLKRLLNKWLNKFLNKNKENIPGTFRDSFYFIIYSEFL